MTKAHDRNKPAPLEDNPGVGSEASFAFANGERSWTEEVDLLELTAAVLEEQNHEVIRHKTWLEHPASGFLLLPQVVSLQPLEKGGVRTVSTVQVHHPDIIPRGVFEYQHAAGDTAAKAFRGGIDQWSRTDFVALLDAARPKPGACMCMLMTLPERDGQPARTRRAIFGPVAHYQSQPPATQAEGAAAAEEHPFCPCCLLTRSFPAFQGLVEAEGFFALRLFALRDQTGAPQADCRVNGEDWKPGFAALRDYAATWPPAGYEFRKQYVILQTIANPEAGPA